MRDGRTASTNARADEGHATEAGDEEKERKCLSGEIAEDVLDMLFLSRGR